jgi:hypothetical protein
MIDEILPEEDRHFLLDLLMRAVPADKPPSPRLLHLISQVSGADTVVICRRAYPSLGGRDFINETCGVGT